MLLKNRAIGTVGYMGGVPAMLSDFVWSLAQMIQFNAESVCGPGEYIHLARATASFHSFARNSLVDQMEGDWLLMLDTDHAFEPDLCLRLIDRMQAYDADVVVGLYQHRQPPHPPVLYLENEAGMFAPIGSWADDADVLTVDSAGAGCVLARRHVFEQIRAELHIGPFDITPPFGEDHSFFKRCKQLGFRVVCDPRIACHHLQVRALTLDDYRRDEVALDAPRHIQGYALREV